MVTRYPCLLWRFLLTSWAVVTRPRYFRDDYFMWFLWAKPAMNHPLINKSRSNTVYKRIVSNFRIKNWFGAVRTVPCFVNITLISSIRDWHCILSKPQLLNKKYFRSYLTNPYQCGIPDIWFLLSFISLSSKFDSFSKCLIYHKINPGAQDVVWQSGEYWSSSLWLMLAGS